MNYSDCELCNNPVLKKYNFSQVALLHHSIQMEYGNFIQIQQHDKIIARMYKELSIGILMIYLQLEGYNILIFTESTEYK